MGVIPLIAHQIPILILISFDGFRPDYVRPWIAPNLYELSNQATRGNMESLFITKTFPNHFSIATGLYEDEHQIINNNMFDPNLNATFKPGIDSSEWWDPDSDRIPIWTALELFGEIRNGGRKRYSGSMMYPGTTTTYVNILPTHLKDYDTKRNWTLNVETVINWLTHPEQPASFVSMYFDDPDNTAHKAGPWGQATLDSIKRVDAAAGLLMKRLRETNLIDKTNILFVSDHGMDEVKNVIYLDDLMNTDHFDLIGSSPTWSVFVKPEKAFLKDKILRDLGRVSKQGHFKILDRSQIPKFYHYSKSPRIGDFFIMVDEKFDLFPHRSKKFKNLAEAWGNHGWDPKDKAMRPLFMALGPSFKDNYEHSKNFPNIDLFPLMATLLELPLELLPNNGTLGHVIDMLKLHDNNPDDENTSITITHDD